MKKNLSGPELRARVLARMAAIRDEPLAGWVEVLSVPGNRELLRLIARNAPQSVSALAELAGRQQPNVSRSLTALVGAGLVEVRSDGRRSVPLVTALGREKGEGMGILPGDAAAPAEVEAPSPQEQDIAEPTLFSVAADSGGTAGAAELPLPGSGAAEDSIPGILSVWLRLRGAAERTIASHDGDLNVLALNVLENWWRIMHRRDAPFRVCDLAFAGDGNPFTLTVASHGRRIEMTTRAHDGIPVMLDDGDRWLTLDAFERCLIEELLSPLADRQRAHGRPDRPLQDRLARLLDSRSSARETAYCKTAGALGLSPYNLEEPIYDRICTLMDTLPDEESRLDFASAVLADGLEEGQSWATAELSTKGAHNVLPRLPELREKCLLSGHQSSPSLPWEKATQLARTARMQLGLGADRSTGGPEGLAKLFGGDHELTRSPKAPGSLRAFQACHASLPTVIVANEGQRRTSFVIARAVGDYLAYGSRASCVADLYTDRQAVGRAFAAEFMAPAEGVIHMIEVEDKSRAEVAAHYGVIPGVITHQYGNNRRSA